MRINDEQARRFYMEECAKAAWSVRQLERQINTMYYQRILASQDKIAAIRGRIETGIKFERISQKRIKTKIQSGSYSKGDLQWSFGFLC